MLIGVAVDTVVKRQDSFLAGLGIPSVEMRIFALGGLTALIWIFESASEYGYSVKWRNLAQRLQHDLRLDERNAVGQLSADYKSANREAIRWSAAITPVIRMAVMTGFITTLVYGGWLTLHGGLAVGAYSILVFLTQRLLWPFTRLADITDLYQRSVASIDRVLNLLAEKITIAYAGKPLSVTQVRGEVRLEDVSFAYAEEPVLTHVDLTIPAGQELALVDIGRR